MSIQKNILPMHFCLAPDFQTCFCRKVRYTKISRLVDHHFQPMDKATIRGLHVAGANLPAKRERPWVGCTHQRYHWFPLGISAGLPRENHATEPEGPAPGNAGPTGLFPRSLDGDSDGRHWKSQLKYGVGFQSGLDSYIDLFFVQLNSSRNSQNKIRWCHLFVPCLVKGLKASRHQVSGISGEEKQRHIKMKNTMGLPHFHLFVNTCSDL